MDSTELAVDIELASGNGKSLSSENGQPIANKSHWMKTTAWKKQCKAIPSVNGPKPRRHLSFSLDANDDDD